MGIIEQMLTKYFISCKEDVYNAMREVCQQIALFGLCRGNFFEKATFYGGTCLRIFYDLPRFSEDMDFSLLQKDENFNIERYFKDIVDEFEALGIETSIRKKEKKDKNNDIELAFLTIDTNQFKIANAYGNMAAIKIKIEADKNPPLYFQTEAKTLLMPKSFNVRTMTLPNLYASKIHAFLFRAWKERVKGRDWFDFEWYVKNNVSLNLEHLFHRIRHFGNLQQNHLTKENLQELLLARILELDIQKAIDDIKNYIKNPEELKIWDKDYFKFLVSNISYQQDEVVIEESLEEVMAKTQEKYDRKEKSQSSTDIQNANILKNDKDKPSGPSGPRM